MAEKITSTSLAPREGQRMTRPEPARFPDPFGMLERFANEMDRVLDEFGFGRTLIGPRPRRSWFGMPVEAGLQAWTPDIGVYQRNDQLVVHADLPGMKKDDVNIEVRDKDLSISGERRQEQHTEQEGVYRTERSYGSFYRTIELPEGAITDQAKATFKDGVLEITMPAPPAQTRGRRLDIKESSDSRK
jgi:HSP20 family protein